MFLLSVMHIVFKKLNWWCQFFYNKFIPSLECKIIIIFCIVVGMLQILLAFHILSFVEIKPALLYVALILGQQISALFSYKCFTQIICLFRWLFQKSELWRMNIFFLGEECRLLLKANFFHPSLISLVRTQNLIQCISNWDISKLCCIT